MLICSSPRLFAACHVLLRRLVPRHPPYALCSLITQPGHTRNLRFRPDSFFDQKPGSEFRLFGFSLKPVLAMVYSRKLLRCFCNYFFSRKSMILILPFSIIFNYSWFFLCCISTTFYENCKMFYQILFLDSQLNCFTFSYYRFTLLNFFDIVLSSL